MVASVNGWRVIGRRDCTDVDVPGGILPVHPEFAWLAWDVAHLWHETVEPLVWPGCWGWSEPRPIRGGSVMTNHASGTAWDLCAPKHPRGVPVRVTFTAGELAAVAAIEARYVGVLRWGGRWTGDDVDGMHWEGVPGVTLEAVRELTARLAGGPAAPPPPEPAPAPAGPVGWPGPDLTGSGLGVRGDAGNSGPRVAALQEFWRNRYPMYARGLATDGFWGPQTTAVCYQFAQRSGIRSADGRNIGQQVARQLYLAGFRS